MKHTVLYVMRESLPGDASCLWECVLVSCSSSSFVSAHRLDVFMFPLSLLMTLCLYLVFGTVMDSFIQEAGGRFAFNFSLVFKSLPICIGHHNICVPMKGKYGLTFYKIPELSIWVSFQAILHVFLINIKM